MMKYSRSMIVVLTVLVSIVGLARPSDDGEAVTTRKLAKGLKKNPPLLFQEEVLVSMVVPKAMASLDMEDAVTKVVRNILTGQQEPDDNDRRNLAFLDTTVEITGTTETKCPEQYLAEVVACYDATVTIGSKEALVDRLLHLTEALDGVISVDDGSIVVTKRRGGYPLVTITNKTPYDTRKVGVYDQKIYTNNVKYSSSSFIFIPLCRDDEYDVAAQQTWTATSRGLCRVKTITAALELPNRTPPGNWLVCDDYKSFPGTTYGTFFIIMNGEDACCVQSSHQSGACA